MNQSLKYRSGVLFGIIAGIVYMLILLVRYVYFGTNPQELGIISAAGLLVMIILFFLAAYNRRNQSGGYADVKELFGTVFIVILFAEISFSIFNFVYLKYIDPGYLVRFTTSTIAWMTKNKLPEAEAKSLLNGLKDQQEITFGTMIMGFARAVIMDSIIGIVISFIMKRKRPVAA